MSLPMTLDEMTRAMRTSLGFSAEKADRLARAQLGIPAVAVVAVPTLVLPFRLSIPWSMLVSDNDKFQGAARRSASGAIRPAMRLTERYKTGKAAITALAREAVGDAAPLREPLVFIGTVFRPSQHRNDATNFSKICHDALSGVVYDDDSRLFRVTWVKVAEPCVDRPRAEIEISKL